MNDQAQPRNRAWRRFRRNPLAMAGLFFIAVVAVVSALGPFIRPDDTVDANAQNLRLSRQSPGFAVDVVRVRTGAGNSSAWEAWKDGGYRRSWEEVPIRSVVAMNDSAITVELFHPTGTGKQKTFANAELYRKEGVSPDDAGAVVFRHTYWLGTDKYGRDLLSRLMAGTTVSLAVGAVAVFISLLVGIVVGLVAGYYRGWVDAVLMWFTNVIWAVPTLLLVMAITFAFGTGFWKVFLAVGLTMWVEVARIVRGQVLGIREKEYIEAARALGYRPARIMFRHILPNTWSPVIVISAANFASAILIEAGLSFLGLGAQIPTPSWGNMIREHYAYITTDLAYLAILPGVCIMLLVLAFMMVGNGLRDALDVR